MTFPTTADSWNRQRDKQFLCGVVGLREQGDSNAKLYPVTATTMTSNDVIANGYERIVFGDHGPYIECGRSQINFDALQLNEAKRAQPLRYYDEWWTADRSLMVYDQVRSVADRPNPPRNAGAVCRGRSEGYADYVPGMCYIDPKHVRVVVSSSSVKDDQEERGSTSTRKKHTTSRLQ